MGKEAFSILGSSMNTASWIVLGIIVLVVIGVIIFMVKTRDKGCCGCGRKDCPNCHHKKDERSK